MLILECFCFFSGEPPAINYGIWDLLMIEMVYIICAVYKCAGVDVTKQHILIKNPIMYQLTSILDQEHWRKISVTLKVGSLLQHRSSFT